MKRFIPFILAGIAALTATCITAHSQVQDYASKTDGPFFMIKGQVVNASGDVIIQHSDYEIYQEDENGFIVKKDGKYAFADSTGTLVSQFFNELEDWLCADGLYVVKGDNYTEGVYDHKTRKMVIPFEQHTISGFGDGLFLVRDIDERVSGRFIDKTGTVVFSTDKFDSENIIFWSRFREGRAIVKKAGGNYGVIDKTGKQIVPFIYDYIEDYSEGLACVIKDGRYGFINKSGQLVIPCIYEEAYNFSCGLVMVRPEGLLYGYINKSGKLVIPCSYKRAGSFDSGLASVYNEKSGDYEVIDKNGKVVFSGMEIRGEIYDNGLAMVEKDGKYGFIDSKNRTEIIPCEYDDIMYCEENHIDYFRVSKEGKFGIVNMAGELIFPCLSTTPVWAYIEFGDVYLFILRNYLQEEQNVVIDKEGNIVLPFNVVDYYKYGDGILFIVKNGPQYGVVDQEGNVVIPFGAKEINFCSRDELNVLLRLNEQ